MRDRSRPHHSAVLLLTVFLSAFAVGKCRAGVDPPYTSDEAAAVARLKAIDVAQQTYKFNNLGGDDTYATLYELRDLGLITWPDVYFIQDGYIFWDILPYAGVRSWGVIAYPYPIGLSGRTFLVTMDHHIRVQNGGNVSAPSDFSAAQNDVAWPILETVGDTDGNGDIDVNDTVMALRSIAGIVPLTEEQTRRADLTQDSRVDVHDAILSLQMALTVLTRQGPEQAARTRLWAIYSAQETFSDPKQGGNGKFATLDQLRDRGLVVWPSPSDFEADGYRYGDIAAPGADAWGVYAVPLEGTAGRTLVVTKWGQIRAGHGNVPPPDIESVYDNNIWATIEGSY